MNWIFKIYKLRALERLHKEHIQSANIWRKVFADNDTAYSFQKMNGHLDEAKKIENLIKFL